MKKPSIIVLTVVTVLLAFQLGDASSQQIPPPAYQVPGEIPSQEAFDELVELVSVQTEAIQSLAARIKDLEARVLELENSGDE